MKLAVQTSPLIERYGHEEAFRMIHAAGFDAVDYNIDVAFPGSAIVKGETTLRTEEDWLEYARPAKEAADRHGVRFHQMHAPFPTFTENPDGTVNVMKAILACIRVCGYLDCPNIIVHPAFLGYHSQLEKQTEWDLNIARYSRMIAYAKKYHVTICLENMFSGYKGKIYGACCAEMAEANRYINRLNEIAGEKVFGFCLDIGHALLVGKEIYNTILEIAPNLTTLHIHDNNGTNDQHLFPYMGVLDWNRFCKGLKDAGYRGALSFETCNALHVIDPELSMEALTFLGATARMFARRIEG